MPPCRETLWKAVDGWIPSVTLCSGRRIHHQQPIVAWETVPGFRSMFSLRRGTEASPPRQPGEGGISTVALLMESDGVGGRRDVPISVISTRALLTESDYGRSGSGKSRSLFQSTLSLRRATPALLVELPGRLISIHALLTESDPSTPRPPCSKRHFNPRSPHGERPSTLTISEGFHLISIHALLTESDQTAAENAQDAAISIHALLTESDQAGDGGDCCRRNFNPRSPHGERRVASGSSRSCHDDFNPRSPHGERLLNSTIFSSAFLFQSTLSSRRATLVAINPEVLLL